MNTCKTCKHWSGQHEDKSYGPSMPMISLIGECNCIKLEERGTQAAAYTKHGGHRWSSMSVVRKDVPMHAIFEAFGNRMEREDDHTLPTDQAFPDASDPHGIGFYTGPDFGCIHHTPKE